MGAYSDRFYIVDISAYLNNDGISYDSNRSDGDFTGHGGTYPAEDLPESDSTVIYNGVRFLFADKSDGADNNIALAGQRIGVSRGRYSSLHLLGASENGNFQEKVALYYNLELIQKLPLGLTSWTGYPKRLFGEKEAIRTTGFHSSSGDVYIGRMNKQRAIWHQTLEVNPDRELISIQLPDNPSMHLFAMTLQRPAIAKD